MLQHAISSSSKFSNFLSNLFIHFVLLASIAQNEWVNNINQGCLHSIKFLYLYYGWQGASYQFWMTDIQINNDQFLNDWFFYCVACFLHIQGTQTSIISILVKIK